MNIKNVLDIELAKDSFQICVLNEENNLGF